MPFVVSFKSNKNALDGSGYILIGAIERKTVSVERISTTIQDISLGKTTIFIDGDRVIIDQ